jgi:hypothetical protein
VVSGTVAPYLGIGAMFVLLSIWDEASSSQPCSDGAVISR